MRILIVSVALLAVSSVIGSPAITQGLTSDKVIVNGVPWYDQRDSVVSARGANIIFDNGKYYLFGEFKTDSANVFIGFSCYSSPDLVNWTYENIALEQQPDGMMGPGRVGERPKVLKSPTTGEYVMIMHSDNMRYKDPCTAYATSPTINGDYTFQGPLLYKGKPIRKWDVGTFVDNDGKSYLLVHHGDIYRFSDDLHSLDSCMSTKVKGVGESPAMLHHNGKYYWFSSHTTSWERNDNMVVSAPSLSGPWSRDTLFAPAGSNTWNTQTTYILPIVSGCDTTFMYMGDRWSFPKQHSAATYVWMPLQWRNGEPFMPEYWEAWSVETMQPATLPLKKVSDKKWVGVKPGESECYTVTLPADGKIYLKGDADDSSAYAEIVITNSKGEKMVETFVDFYSLTPSHGLRYISPEFPNGKYNMKVTVSDMKPNWSDKRKNNYGSKGYKVVVTEVGTF